MNDTRIPIPAACLPGDLDAWQRLDDVLANHQRFTLTTHINPDGDGIGSEVALALHLIERGKDVVIFNASSALSAQHHLHSGSVTIAVYDEQFHRQRLLMSDAIIVLDTAEWSRLGSLAEAIRQAYGKLVVIDHHVCLQRMGDVFLSVPNASSTGELIYHLIKRQQTALTPEICRALYIAIASDTGWFRFDNASSSVLRIAAELIDHGVQPQRIYREIYENTTWTDVELFRRLVNRMRHSDDGHIVIIHQTLEDYTELAGGDSDRILDYALSIPETEVVLFFKHISDGATKLSLRSRGRVDVGELARNLGGGGHANASGVLMRISPAELEANVLARVSTLLSEQLQSEQLPFERNGQNGDNA
jgi:phosphoesterase RecJ-like protein